VRMSDASNSGGRAKGSKSDTGVLGNLPRTRPQRSSPRRAAARKAASASTANASSASAPTGGVAIGAEGKTSTKASAEGKTSTKAPPESKTSTKASSKTSAKTSSPTAAGRRTGPRPSAKAKTAKAKRSVRATAGEDAVPRQGFESDGVIASGSVQPPGATELVSSAAELAGELAKAGVSGGARLLKDLFARLPPG
jgi:hypothetical protein